MYMVFQRIAFRTDANSEIGTGHFMRCLALADELKKHGAEIYFISRGMPLYLIRMLQERDINFHGLPDTDVATIDELPHSKWLKTSQYQDAIQTIDALGKNKLDWLVVDHYALDHRFETPLRALADRVIVIDDLADRLHDCDVLVDQNFYQDMDRRYIGKVPKNCQLLLGPVYALLRDEFREKRKCVKLRTGDINNILVFFGGVDACNYTAVALNALVTLDWDVQVNVVVGQKHPHIQDIQDLCEAKRFELHVQTKKMAHLMAQADLAIGAGGSSIWERFSMRLPSICISSSENQRQQIIDLEIEGLVIAPNKNKDLIDSICQTLCEIKSKSNLHKEMSEKNFHLVDGNGVIRLSKVLLARKIQMRLADKEDTRNIFGWRNHPSIRRNSRSADEIQWVDHEKWFSQRSGQINQPILIGEIEKKPVGVVRFDIRENFAEVSIYLVPDSGNHGLGRNLLSEAEAWLKTNHPHVVAVHAEVLHANESSKRLFTNLHYVKHAGVDQLLFIKKL